MPVFHDTSLLWCSNSTPGCVRKCICVVELVRGHSVLFVIIAKLMKTLQMSMGGWIEKQSVFCTYGHKILPDHRKEWDGMVRQLHSLGGHESEQSPGDGEGQGGLECCSPWGRKESDTTERLNSNNKEECTNRASLVAQMVKASASNAGDPGSIPGTGRSPGEGNGNPLQYCCLENFMDGEAWWAIVHGVTKSRTRLSNFTQPQCTNHTGFSMREPWNHYARSQKTAQAVCLFTYNTQHKETYREKGESWSPKASRWPGMRSDLVGRRLLFGGKKCPDLDCGGGKSVNTLKSVSLSILKVHFNLLTCIYLNTTHCMLLEFNADFLN